MKGALSVRKDERHLDQAPGGKTTAAARRRPPLVPSLLVLPMMLWAPSAWAQHGGTTQSAVVPANPAFAAKPEPSPEHIEKARQLILATGISRSFEIIIPEFMDQIGQTVTQARPDLIHDMNIVLETLKPEFDRQSTEMVDQSARIYATLLSEKDIDAINAFFTSDAGKHYVAAQPFFLNQLVSGMQAWQQKISINMMARVREEMKKKGHDL